MIEDGKAHDFRRNFRCGATVTYIGQWATAFPLFCGKWGCQDCKKRKVKKAQAEVKAFAGIFVYAAELELAGKELTLWVRRNLKSGKYLRLKLPERTVIIAEKSFPGCRRREKKKFVSELPGLLAGVECGRVISMRRHKRQDGGDKVKRIKYGLFNGDHQIEFNALRSDFERARWLNEQKGGKLLPDGDELVRRYRNGELQPDKPKSAAPGILIRIRCSIRKVTNRTAPLCRGEFSRTKSVSTEASTITTCPLYAPGFFSSVRIII